MAPSEHAPVLGVDQEPQNQAVEGTAPVLPLRPASRSGTPTTGHQPIERTPRFVQLSPSGVTFLERARDLVDAHDFALAVFTEPRQRAALGISDHVAGSDLPALIARMNTRGSAASHQDQDRLILRPASKL